MRIAPILAAAAMLAVGAGTWVWIKDTSATQQEPQRPAGKGKRFAAGADAIPVTAVPVTLADVAVHREGIGNVQALAAVLVRAQVDGRLMSVEFTEGQDVEKGQILARIDASVYQAQLDQALAKKAQNEAMLANARLDLARAQKLTTLNAGAKKTEDTANAQVRQFEAQIRADEGAIDNARAVMGFTTILAPITGRAGLRMVDPGNLLRGDSTAIVSVMQTTPIGVVFTLPQRDLAVVSAAMARGTIPIEVLASDGTTVIASGRLSTIDNQIDQTTGTIKLKAEVANDGRRLWPGQFVTVRVVVDTLQGAKVVPTAAIRRGPPGTFVYTVDADSRARMTPVEVSLESDGRAIIAKGVEAGAQVVTVGFARLSDGKEVDVVVPADQAAPKPAGEAGQKKRREGKRGAAAAPSSDAATAGTTPPVPAATKGTRP
jgi:membrane fusion protein, multidrug efflux system